MTKNLIKFLFCISLLHSFLSADVQVWDNSEGEIENGEYVKIGYTSMVNVGDINDDGNDDVVAIANDSGLHIILMGNNGLPQGGQKTIKLYPNNIPTMHDEGFRTQIATDIYEYEDEARFIDVAYIGADPSFQKIAVLLKKSNAGVTSTLYANSYTYVLYIDVNGNIFDFNKLNFQNNSDCGYTKFTTISNIGDIDSDGYDDLAFTVDDGEHKIDGWGEGVDPNYFVAYGSVLIANLTSSNTLKNTIIFNANNNGLVTGIDGFSTIDEYYPWMGAGGNKKRVPSIKFASEIYSETNENAVHGIIPLGTIDNSGLYYLFVNGIVFGVNSSGIFQPKNINLESTLTSLIESNFVWAGGKLHILGDLNNDSYIEFVGIPMIEFGDPVDYKRDTTERVIYSIIPNGSGENLTISFTEYNRMNVANGLLIEDMIHREPKFLCWTPSPVFNHWAGGSCIIKNLTNKHFIFGSELNLIPIDNVNMVPSYSIDIDGIMSEIIDPDPNIIDMTPIYMLLDLL